MEAIISNIRSTLKNKATEKVKLAAGRFFKGELKSYGVKNPEVRSISKEYFKEVASRSKPEIFKLCEVLWRSGYIEEGFVACHWSYAVRKRFEPSDFDTFIHWIDSYITNWATCDTFCNHTLGTFLVMYPKHVPKLEKLAVSGNRWMRRAAAVSLIVPARKGLFLKESLNIALLLLEDSDDMVQKGYGWLLKSASQADNQLIFNFVMQHKTTMPRTALRYAIEKMSPELRAMAMAK